MSKLLNLLFILLLGGWTTAVSAQQWIETDDGNRTNRSSIRTIEALPAPNTLRNAAGAPGPDYWQQQVDYDIEATLDTVPVEAWRTNERSFTKGFFSNKTVRQVDLDPDEKFADIDRSNNHWEATTELQDAER